MPFVIVKPEHAEHLNRSIMRLLRPAHLRDGYTTDVYCRTVTHPQLGYVALELPDVETVPVHIEADGQELSALMQVFVNDQAISQAEADAVVGAIQMTAGQEVRVADFIPPSWTANVLSRSQMEATGWFPVANL